MNVEDYKNMDIETLERTKQLITEIINENKVPASKTEWFKSDYPDKYTQYHYLDENLDVYAETWTENFEDRQRYQNGNIFKSIEEAQKYVRRLRVQRELEVFIKVYATKEIDWTDNKPKYVIVYDRVHGNLFVSLTRTYLANSIYFSSSELAKKAIEVIGEENLELLYNPLLR